MRENRPPVETDPLGAIRKELLTAAWRRKAADDRRRRLLVTVATMLVSLACVAGGAAAAGVDLPVIGDALHALSVLNEADHKADVNGERDPTEPRNLAEIKPGPGNSTETLGFPWATGGSGAAAAYLNTQDQICFVVAGPHGEANQGGCMSPRLLAERLDDGIAYLQGVSSAASTVVTGYVSEEVERIGVRGPQGMFDVRLSEPWKPDVAGAIAFKAFVATADSGGEGGLDMAEANEVLDARNYVIEGHLSDGRTVTVRP